MTELKVCWHTMPGMRLHDHPQGMYDEVGRQEAMALAKFPPGSRCVLHVGAHPGVGGAE